MRGVRHSSKDYPKGSPPWLGDLISGVAPEYSYSDRAAHHQGRGFFLLSVDLKTGAVANIRVAQSTGFKTLDDSAMSAFRRWRWKPGKWKEVDIPVTFEIRRSAPLPPGAVRLPPAK
jgi:TonB family protein